MQEAISTEKIELEKVLKSKLSEVSTVSITTDIWSDSRMRGYLGLTAHFIYKNQLTSAVLAVPRFRGKQIFTFTYLLFIYLLLLVLS